MIILQFFVMPPPPDERDDDLVDARYVAARFGCSVRSVQAGKCGTAALPRISKDPLRFRRADVDAELRRKIEEARTPQQKALRLLNRKPRRKRSAA